MEVLSQSTEADDRGEKFRRYLMLDSLEQYVLVSQQSPLVETFTRLSDGTWRFGPTAGMDTRVKWTSIDVELPLTEIYAGIQFPPEEEQVQLF